MEEIDSDIAKVFEKFNDDEDLRMQPYSYVEETWVRLDDILRKRTESVDAFGAGMEELEIGRAKTMGIVMERLCSRIDNGVLCIERRNSSYC